MKLQRAVFDFGIEHSFAKANKSLLEHYYFQLPLSKVAQITIHHAKKIAASQMKEQEVLSLPLEGSNAIISEADGSFIRIVKTTGKYSDKRKNRDIEFKEARLCASKNHGETQTYYAATFDQVDEAGRLWAKTAKDAGRGLVTEIHCVADGAPWIQNQAQNYLQPKRFLVDFYHTCEYLHEAQATCANNSRWMKTQKNRLKKNRADRVLDNLREHLEPKEYTDADSPVRRANRYLENRLEQLDYQGAIEEDLPIGSGLIESGHKHVLQARLKIPGAAWKMVTADAIAKARAARASDQADLYWN